MLYFLERFFWNTLNFLYFFVFPRWPFWKGGSRKTKNIFLERLFWKYRKVYSRRTKITFRKVFLEYINFFIFQERFFLNYIFVHLKRPFHNYKKISVMKRHFQNMFLYFWKGSSGIMFYTSKKTFAELCFYTFGKASMKE